MNLLQGIAAPEPLIVTLNPVRPIDPKATLRTLRYHHPIYSHESVEAQSRRPQIQGVDRTWYAGAYWGWGFHEDGMRSAVEVAAALGAPWDLEAAGANLMPMPTRGLAA
jgi:predicted NAD/FAD-binding protein